MFRFQTINACAFTIFAVSSAVGQQDFSDVTIRATKVAGHIHMLEGRGGNLGVSVGGVEDLDVGAIRRELRLAVHHGPRHELVLTAGEPGAADHQQDSDEPVYSVKRSHYQ